MTRTKNIYLALLAVLLSPMAANAVVIHDESSDGDILEDGFVFSDGLNEIIGDLIYTEDLFDFDIFDFTLPDSGTLLSVTYSFFDVSLLDATTRLGSNLRIRTPSDLSNSCILNSSSFGEVVDVTSGSGSQFFNSCAGTTGSISAFDFVGGTWGWSHNLGRTETVLGAGGGSWGYSIVFDVDAPVSSVPEPGTLALLGLGLVGMAARRKKKV